MSALWPSRASALDSQTHQVCSTTQTHPSLCPELPLKWNHKTTLCPVKESSHQWDGYCRHLSKQSPLPHIDEAVSTAPRGIPETIMVAVEGQAGDDQGNVSLYLRLEGWLLLLFNNDLIFPPNYCPVMQLPCLWHQRQGRRWSHLWAGLHVVGSRTEETARVA